MKKAMQTIYQSKKNTPKLTSKQQEKNLIPQKKEENMLVACCNKHQVTVTMKEDLVVGHDVLYADNKIFVMECALKYFKVNFV